MGDRWRPDLLGSSRYIWYPLSWASGSPQIVPADVWSIDIAAGTYSVASGVAYEAESGTISGSARILTGSYFSGGEAVGYIGTCYLYTLPLSFTKHIARSRWLCDDK